MRLVVFSILVCALLLIEILSSGRSLAFAQNNNVYANTASGLQFVNQDLSNAEFENCKSVVLQMESVVPAKHFAAIKRIFLHNDNNLPRGLASATEIHLQCNLPQPELMAVAIHELGHIVDLGLLISNENLIASNFSNGSEKQFISDPSVTFYEYGWLNATKPISKDLQNFVSGYAASGAFEDFAESYIFYILHGNEFRLLAEGNPTLLKKYNFLKYFIFGGKEYGFTTQTYDLTSGNLFANMNTRYDVTRLSYAL